MQEITGYVVCEKGNPVPIRMDISEEVSFEVYTTPIPIFSDESDANTAACNHADLYGQDAKIYEIRKVTLTISDEITPIDASKHGEDEDGDGEMDCDED